MKVRLLNDVTTPEGWVGEKRKREAGVYFEAGQIVKVIPADNLPADSRIKLWVDEESVQDHPYGVGLYAEDFEYLNGAKP